jgi:iron complex outermembrane receptor protein
MGSAQENSNKYEKFPGGLDMKVTWLASACVAAMFPTFASAETTPDDAANHGKPVAERAADASTGVVVGEIVVTAQRREERLRDVPISITALTADKIANAGLVGTRDLQQVTPGLISQNSGYQFRPTIRGVGGYAGGGAGDESNVALYIDNVYMSSPGANAFNLMNIERIEVLKGPQGTLFGRNATGGAIRIITADPAYDNSFKATASYGFELKSREFNGLENLKITDGIAASLSEYYYRDDGYVTNINPTWTGGKLARLDTSGLRGKLLFQPTSDLKVVLAADYSRSYSTQEQTLAPVGGSLSFRNVVGTILPTEPLTADNTDESYQIVRTGGASVTVNWDVGKFSLQSTSVARTNDVYGKADGDRTNLELSYSNFSVYQDVKTQELIATSNFEGPLNFVGGLYYFDSDSRSPNGRLVSAPLSPVVNGVRTVTGPAVTTSLVQGEVQTTSYSAFSEATLNLSSAFSLIGGVRYTDEHKSAAINNALRLDLGASTGKLSFDNVSYRLTGRYKYDDTGMIYLTRSTGFKSGQFNATAFTFPLTTVRPETLMASEIGLKDRFFGFLDLALAAYDYQYNDIQLTVFNTFNPALGTNILLNAAKAHTQGAELQLDAHVGQKLSLTLGASYLPVAAYTKFPNGIDYVPRPDLLGNFQVVTDLSGARMPYSPKFTTNAGATYTTELGEGHLTTSANAYYKSRFEWIPGHRFGQDAYTIVNATINWTAPGDRWSIGVYGRNLTDQHYFTAGAATTAGFSGAWARPREIGVTIGIGL